MMSKAKNEFQVSLELADKSQEPRWRELCLQEIITSLILNNITLCGDFCDDQFQSFVQAALTALNHPLRI